MKYLKFMLGFLKEFDQDAIFWFLGTWLLWIYDNFL